MTEEACNSDIGMGMDIELEEEIVTTQECGSLRGKCLISSNDADNDAQRLFHGLDNFLKQCQTLGRFDLCDYLQSNMSQQHYLHKSCRQKWLKLVKQTSNETVAKSLLQL
jgi:hypothetical protein